MKALKQLCIPRKSVFDISKRDTVLNLTHLTDDKISAAEFFGENSVTDGMRTLLIEAHRRLQGKSSQAVFKLTQGNGRVLWQCGGKTPTKCHVSAEPVRNHHTRGRNRSSVSSLITFVAADARAEAVRRSQPT